MLVEQLLSAARERLVTRPDDAPLIKASILLRTRGELIIMCYFTILLTNAISQGSAR